MDLAEAFAELNLVQDFIPVGASNRPGTRLIPICVTIHNTDNPARGADAAAHARYQKGADARKREVSWHFTVDDIAVYQSLPVNEIGWHAGTREGNSKSIGIEICMNEGLDETAAYSRAALLTAAMLFQNQIPVRNGVKQHNEWTGKDCPSVLRGRPNGWTDFVADVARILGSLESAPTIRLSLGEGLPLGLEHHHVSEIPSGRRKRG